MATHISISLPSDLARELDVVASEKGYAKRSQAVAGLVRADLVEHRQSTGGQIAGTITLLFNHHKPKLQGLLTDVQHDHTDLIVLAIAEDENLSMESYLPNSIFTRKS